MSGWELLVWGATAGLGTLMFLKLVAHHILVTETVLDRYERREREAYEEREAPPSDEPVTAVFEAKLT